MAKILGAYLLPHPPIIVEEIGGAEGEDAKATIDGMKSISKDIKAKAPSTIIIITPHGPLFRDANSISIDEKLSGNFGRFGHFELKFEYENNLEMAERIIENSLKAEIPIVKIDDNLSEQHNIDKSLDHGTLVPLYYVDKEYRDYKLIHITYGLLSPEELFRFGQAIEKSVGELNDDVVIIASGDLSHKLSNDGPYEYSPKGKVFDEEVINIIKEGRLKDIINFDLDLAEEAGECGLCSLIIMAGAIDKYRLRTEILSYEGPFGVGYSTAKIDLSEKEEESEYVKLARESLEYYIKNGEYLKINKSLMGMPKGVFVTLYRDGMLRGCIGTILPTKDSIELEIIQNAVSAGLQDPRFPPVEESELDELVYSVDILSEAEVISTIGELDVNKYGIIVSKGPRKGLLLPNLEGVDSVEEQLAIALDKANIRYDEEYRMERFRVKRYY